MKDNCKHENAYLIYNEADGQIIKCDKCGKIFDENFEEIKTPDEIPF